MISHGQSGRERERRICLADFHFRCNRQMETVKAQQKELGGVGGRRESQRKVVGKKAKQIAKEQGLVQRGAYRIRHGQCTPRLVHGIETKPTIGRWQGLSGDVCLRGYKGKALGDISTAFNKIEATKNRPRPLVSKRNTYTNATRILQCSGSNRDRQLHLWLGALSISFKGHSHLLFFFSRHFSRHQRLLERVGNKYFSIRVIHVSSRTAEMDSSFSLCHPAFLVSFPFFW